MGGVEARLSRELCVFYSTSSRLALGLRRPVRGKASGAFQMATQQGTPSSALRVLEEALGMGLSAAGDTAEAVAAEGAYYLERILRV